MGSEQTDCIDVLVIGGGTAGVVAAIQAARLGADTVLVEKGGQPGGTLATAGVNFPGLFWAHGHQVIAGVGWDLVRRCVEEGGDTLRDYRDLNRPHWQHQVRLNRFLYPALCDEAMTEAGVRRAYHSQLAELAWNEEENCWDALICGKPAWSHCVLGCSSIVAVMPTPVGSRDSHSDARIPFSRRP
jgi:choline dehydrogenase-like flavoprotein